MANPRWSSSRLSSIGQCSTAYINTYINELVMVGGKTADVLDKGTAAHEICEWYDSTKTEDELRAEVDRVVALHNYDKDKYDLKLMVPRFMAFWNQFVRPKEADGYKVIKEGWKNFRIGNTGPWVGALDLVVRKGDDVHIIDYKSGGSAKLDKGYLKQLMIYALAFGHENKWTVEQMAANIKVYLFFPIAGLKEEEQTDPLVAEKQAMKNLKSSSLDAQDLEDLVREIEVEVLRDGVTDWSKKTGMDGSMGFWCSWCPYKGSVRSQSDHPGFIPCELTYNEDFRSSRGVKFIPKEEAKRLGKAT